MPAQIAPAGVADMESPAVNVFVEFSVTQFGMEGVPALKLKLLQSRLYIINPLAGDAMAFRSAMVMRGIVMPCVVLLISSIVDGSAVAPVVFMAVPCEKLSCNERMQLLIKRNIFFIRDVVCKG